MALIKCPNCGKQISDKAVICPHCGIDVKKLQTEIREKQRQLKIKRWKRIITSMAFIIVITAVAIVAYLYYIDALNTIPSEYRKQTEWYFEKCEIATNSGDYKTGNEFLNELTGRTFTKRQAKRFEELRARVEELTLCEMKKEAEKALQDVEEHIVKIEASYSETGMKQVKKDLSTINVNLLDSLQSQRLILVNEKYVKLQLAEMESNLGIYKDTGNSYYYDLIMKYVMDLQDVGLSDVQKAKCDKIIAEAKKIKKQQQEADQKRAQLLRTMKDEYVRMVDLYSDCGCSYFLFDITGDGLSELWIKVGVCEYEYQELLVYTYDKGMKLLYNEKIGNATFSEYNGGIVQVIRLNLVDTICIMLSYTGRKIVSRVLEGGSMKSDKYLVLTTGRRVKVYPSNNKQPIMDAFGIR